jgi:hypothetical protein
LDTGPVRAAPQRLAAEEQLGFGMVVADRFVATKQWRALALVAVLVLAVDLNELLWIAASSAAVQRFWEWPYRLVIASGLWRALSLPFMATVAAWALSLALVIAGRRRGQIGA